MSQDGKDQHILEMEIMLLDKQSNLHKLAQTE
jgi:hypothetical protein